jgi:hypothetical protein
MFWFFRYRETWPLKLAPEEEPLKCEASFLNGFIRTYSTKKTARVSGREFVRDLRRVLPQALRILSEETTV